MTACGVAGRGGVTAWARRLARHEGGAALIEFTLVLPVLMVLVVGMAEFSEAYSVRRKLASASATVADLVAQMPQVSTGDLGDIAHVADTLLAPHEPARLGLVITSVTVDGAGAARVAWSFARGAGTTARATGGSVALPAGLAEPQSSVILAETAYGFSPTVGLSLTGLVTLRGVGYFRPRLTPSVPKVN